MSQTTAETDELQTRIETLETEVRHLEAERSVLEAVAGSGHFVDILQTITGKLGEMFGLDRCSIFLTERETSGVRLVASYEDPGLREVSVNLEAYPEIRRSLELGETVIIPDVQSDPSLNHARDSLESRRAQSITVVPIRWDDETVGAIFLRTFEGGTTFSESDIQFTRRIAGVTARALRTAYRISELEMSAGAPPNEVRANRERVALVSFLTKFFARYEHFSSASSSDQLPDATESELNRLVDVALTVLGEEGKGTPSA